MNHERFPHRWKFLPSQRKVSSHYILPYCTVRCLLSAQITNERKIGPSEYFVIGKPVAVVVVDTTIAVVAVVSVVVVCFTLSRLLQLALFSYL